MFLRNLFFTTVIITRRRGKFTPEFKTRLQEDAKKLVDLFEGVSCEVFFTGGAGLAWSIGDFTRYHNDFDIAIYSKNLEVLTTHLKSKRYRLVKRHFSTHISPWHDLQVVVDYNLNQYYQSTRDAIRIRGLKMGSPFRIIRRRFHHFDIFLWNKYPEGIIPIDTETIIPWDDFFPTNQISENSGLIFPNSRHKKYLPESNSEKTVLMRPEDQ